jgi:hypothetical protein
LGSIYAAKRQRTDDCFQKESETAGETAEPGEAERKKKKVLGAGRAEVTAAQDHS